MSNEVAVTTIPQEHYEIADCYISCGLNIRETAATLNKLPEEISSIVNNITIIQYINSIENSKGLKNTRTFFEEMEDLILAKKNEMAESGLASGTDIMVMMSFFHKMKMEEEKLALKRLELEIKREAVKRGGNGTTKNTQINIGAESVKGLPAVMQAIMEAK